MNIAVHQENDNHEKMGKREARKGRKQSTDFKKTTCCPHAVLQKAIQRKNGLCEESARGN